MKNKIEIEPDCDELENALEKANQLAEPLREVQKIIDSLSVIKRIINLIY